MVEINYPNINIPVVLFILISVIQWDDWFCSGLTFVIRAVHPSVYVYSTK